MYNSEIRYTKNTYFPDRGCVHTLLTLYVYAAGFYRYILFVVRFVTCLRGQVEGKGRKSKEQLEAEKRAILKQRIKPLEVDGLDAPKLTEKAKELHGLIYRLEGEKYDLEKRFKSQQIDVCYQLN